MSESEAEWIDFEREFGGKLPSVPKNPTIRPTAVPRPTRPFVSRPFPDGGRPRNPTEHPSVNETHSSYSKAPVISISVISCLIFVALILVLMYLFVLKKKLRKVSKTKSDSQYCLRVEDVAHLDIDDSNNLYANTTDLQKLVSSISSKNKNKQNGTDINSSTKSMPIQDAVPEANHQQPSIMEIVADRRNKGAIKLNGESMTRPKIPPPSPPKDFSEDKITYPKIIRAAPPPPLSPRHAEIPEHLKTFTDNVSNKDKYPSLAPKPHLQRNENISPIFSPNEGLPQKSMAFSPKVSDQKPRPSLNPKPKINHHKNPILPMLIVKPSDKITGQDSGFSTPETSDSFLSHTSAIKIEDSLEKLENDPANMSVMAKKAFLEQLMSKDNSRRN